MEMDKKSIGLGGCGKIKQGIKTRKRRSDPSVKVVYISTPMKVKTSASRFRTIVQELTGRDSDVSRFADGAEFDDDSGPVSPAQTVAEEPTSSDSLMDPFENGFGSQMDERLSEMFTNSLFYDNSSRLDAFGSL